MSKDGTEARITVLPSCAFCARPAAYDAKVAGAGWAYLCQLHWQRHTYMQLGTGLGQRLVVERAEP